MRRLKARLWFSFGLMLRFYGLRTGERRYFQRAEDAFCHALDDVPTFHAARYQRGLLYWREMHLPLRAIEDFTDVLRDGEGYSDALLMRGMAYEQLGDFKAAADDLDLFLRLDPHSRWAANAARQLKNIRAILEEMPHRLDSGKKKSK